VTQNSWARGVLFRIADIGDQFFVAEPSGALYGMLAMLGIIVALLNITAKEVNMYMVSSIAFIVSFSAVQQLVTAAGRRYQHGLASLQRT